MGHSHVQARGKATFFQEIRHSVHEFSSFDNTAGKQHQDRTPGVLHPRVRGVGRVDFNGAWEHVFEG